jgi:prepilin-type N-terminal cleavage/methylation domain-containing protein
MRHRGGFTLIEVMVAISILGTAMLGLMAWYAYTLRDQKVREVKESEMKVLHEVQAHAVTDGSFPPASRSFVFDAKGELSGAPSYVVKLEQVDASSSVLPYRSERLEAYMATLFQVNETNNPIRSVMILRSKHDED